MKLLRFTLVAYQALIIKMALELFRILKKLLALQISM